MLIRRRHLTWACKKLRFLVRLFSCRLAGARKSLFQQRFFYSYNPLRCVHAQRGAGRMPTLPWARDVQPYALHPALKYLPIIVSARSRAAV